MLFKPMHKLHWIYDIYHRVFRTREISHALTYPMLCYESQYKSVGLASHSTHIKIYHICEWVQYTQCKISNMHSYMVYKLYYPNHTVSCDGWKSILVCGEASQSNFPWLETRVKIYVAIAFIIELPANAGGVVTLWRILLTPFKFACKSYHCIFS